jgi:hypothetical protein
MDTIIVQFNNPGANLYNNRHLEIRNIGSQIRFYEVDKQNNKEYCLAKETISWLLHTKSIPRKDVVIKAVEGDKSIFNT